MIVASGTSVPSAVSEDSVLPHVSRIEVITQVGREYVLHLESPGVYYQVQDSGRTLKIFVQEK